MNIFNYMRHICKTYQHFILELLSTTSQMHYIESGDGNYTSGSAPAVVQEKCIVCMLLCIVHVQR